jgi:hypothetical protein
MGATLMNIFIGAMFLAFFLSIYRNRNNNISTGLKKGKSGSKVEKDKK